jgi:hypothetical protein
MECVGVADLASFAQALDVREEARLTFEPSRRGVISWNTRAPHGHVRFRLLRAGTPASAWYDFAEWQPSGRKSYSAQSDRDGVHVDIDVVQSDQPFDGIDIRAEGIDFDLVAFATPVRGTPSLPYGRDAIALDVPQYSQYIVETERGWCSPASLSMVNAYHGVHENVEETAIAVMDRAYNGTGNWTFNVAFSGSRGLRGVVTYLQNLDHAQRLIERNVPIVISYSWSKDELPGAPLAHSDGHLAVLCGFTATGDCVMNDPAAHGVRIIYPRTALENIWMRNGGVAYIVSPKSVDYKSVLTSPA